MKKSIKKVVVNTVGAVQGDVPILRIQSLTPNGKSTKNRVVAMGEATGHDHHLVGTCERYTVSREIGGQLFRGMEIVVSEGQSVELVHKSNGEHYAIEMTPGLYFIPAPGQQQVEYDGEAERRILD